MSEPVYLSKEGRLKLEAELKKLKYKDRPEVVAEIKRTREMGDLSENAEYHAAKDRQGMIHARMKYIEDVLSRAEVIDPTKLSGDRVKFGAKVTVLNVETDEESVYQILGPEEADIKLHQISVSSPLARALLGHEVGDEVTVRLPGGTKNYEIEDITFR